MDNKKNFDPVYTNRVKAGRRRTYFFDVRKTKGDDYFISMTESTRRYEGDGYERHKIFLYKEDFNKFLKNLEDAINHVKTELMPEFDYDSYANDFGDEAQQSESEQDATEIEDKEDPETGGITSASDMEW